MCFRKIVTFFIIISLLFVNVPGLLTPVNAADNTVNLYISDYRAGTLTFGWDPVLYAKSVQVTWHDPQVGLQDPVIVNQTENTYQITDLQNDYIYDIKVEIFDGENATGKKLSEGFIYFCPAISFYSTPGKQDYVELAGGGRESGSSPRLNLKWAKPKVWNGTNFAYIDESLEYMESQINSVYNDNRELSSFGFRINISSDIRTLNSGSLQQSILVEPQDSDYFACVSGTPDITSKVRESDADGYMSLELIGRADENSSLPQALEYELPDPDIFPGTVYYMNIKPIFKNSVGDNVNAFTLGVPSQMNGSPLAGALPYTYSQIRFQLSKDASGNIYVKIFKLNQGSLDLPRLYYEIQASDDPSIIGDWDVKDTMDDSYFAYGSPYAVTIIPGINVSNTIYYKIVVKSDSHTDRITSQPMPYRIDEDTSRPPALTLVKAEDATLNVRETVDPDTGEASLEKTTNIVVSWQKPADWQSIISNNDPHEDIYVHILLSTSQTDQEIEPIPYLVAEGKVYGQFQPRFRLVKYFNLRSPNIKVNGERLEYVLDGFDLFKGEDADGVSDEKIGNGESYPDFLLTNTVYYIQMYTTKSEAHKGSTNEEHMSDKSITTSFTTLSTKERDVPLPMNVRVSKNEIDLMDEKNIIELSLSKINIDWRYYTDSSAEKNIYYDFFMSTDINPQSFILIGSTEDTDGDISFLGLESSSTVVNAVIKNFSSQQLINRFGYNTRSNSTYYFMIRTRLKVAGQEDRVSDLTSILPVTTIRKVEGIPDEGSKRPAAPIDFMVLDDNSGEPGVTGAIVTFEWTRQEINESYQLICTSNYLRPDAALEDYRDDAVYMSFISAFGGPINLNPDRDPPENNLVYDEESKTFRFVIDRWIYPNRLYYFSLRTIDKSSGTHSAWISIPVTTALIDAPTNIEAVTGFELKFSWKDVSMPDSGSYRVYIKQNGSKDYQLLSLSYYQIVRDNSDYYATVHNLKGETTYDIRVVRGLSGISVFEKYNLNTRDGYHQIEVKWKGFEGYKYELAIKAENDEDYTILTDVDFEIIRDNYGQLNPWYVEKSLDTSGTSYGNYFARIKTIPVYENGRITDHKELLSNTRYYVKVRSVKVDSLNTHIVSYSKYNGPCNTRTEFSSEDYEENEKIILIKQMFTDRLEDFKSLPFWRVDMSGADVSKIFLKSDRITGQIFYGTGSTTKIDLTKIPMHSEYATNFFAQDNYVVYIPSNVVQALKSTGSSLSFILANSEITMRPGSFEANTKEPSDALEHLDISDKMVALSANKASVNTRSISSGLEPVSDTLDFTADELGISKTGTQIEEYIDECLFGTESGLVKTKLDILTDPYNGNVNGTNEEIAQYIDRLILEIEEELSIYIYNLFGEVTQTIDPIETFNEPATINMTVWDANNRISPYVMMEGRSDLTEIEKHVSRFGNRVSFNTVNTGTFIMLKSVPKGEDTLLSIGIPNNTVEFLVNSGLIDLLKDVSPMYYYSKASVGSAISIFEKLSGSQIMNNRTDTKTKSRLFGLDGFLQAANEKQNITRQEAAVLVSELYSLRSAISIQKYSPAKVIYFLDEKDIDKKLYRHVSMAVDLDFIQIDNKGNFLPDKGINLIDLISAFERVFEITGD